MILLDGNLLIYAYAKDFPEHIEARTWLDSTLNKGIRVGIPWVVGLAFLRIVTNPRLFQQPAPINDAWSQLESWLSLGNVWIPQPTENHRITLAELISHKPMQGNLIQDAHLAALSIEHGLTVYSNDTDFAKFRGVAWVNPLDRGSAL